MSVSAILPEKSRENKKCEEEEQKKKNKNKKKKNDKILGIWQHFKMAVTWLYATFFDIYVLTLSRTARWFQYLINSAFLSFSGVAKNRS